MSKFYEVIIYTASLAEYADAVMDKIDPKRLTSGRLYRDSCLYYKGLFVKDLSKLNRNIKDLIIIDVNLFILIVEL